MAKFVQSEKVSIEVNDKSYNLKTDSLILSTAILANIKGLEEAKIKAASLEQQFKSGDLDFDGYIDDIYNAFGIIELESRKFIIRMLGQKEFLEIETMIGGFTFDDYNNMSNLIMNEIVKLKHIKQKNIIEGVVDRE